MKDLINNLDVMIDEIYAKASLSEDFLLDDIESDSKDDSLVTEPSNISR